MCNVAALLLVLLSLTALCAIVVPPIKAGSKTIFVPTDYNTIQGAVDHASSGDTVFVWSGTYTESVSINKSLSLIGENKDKTMILGDWRLGGTVVLVSHDGVTVKGLTIRSVADNTHGDSIRGVHLLHVHNCNVSDCVLLGNGFGIWLYESSGNIIEDNFVDGQFSTGRVPLSGIQLEESAYNRVLGNTVTDNAVGVTLSASFGNNLTGNFLTNNYSGINVGSSDNNTIMDNSIFSKRYGITQTSSSNNIILNNALSGNPTGIQISLSCFNLVEGNVIDHSSYCGLELHDDASHNNVIGNNIIQNKDGVEVKFSSNNTLKNNNITANEGIGAVFEEASNNLIYKNNFINNGLHASNSESRNTWDASGKGNYWDNYTGTDIDNNGIGETPYIIDESNRDNYPLTEIATTQDFQHEDTSPTPTTAPSSTPTAPSSEMLTTPPFPTVLVAVAAAIGLGIIVYFTKIKKNQSINATKGS
jgi:nitrous oxidase accessory protein